MNWMTGGVEDDEARLARNVARARERREWSQEDVARRMAEHGFKWHQNTVSRLEKGDRSLKMTEALALARIFETSVDGLVADPDEQDLLRSITFDVELLPKLRDRVHRDLSLIEATHESLEAGLPALEKYGAEEHAGRLAQGRDALQITARAVIAEWRPGLGLDREEA